MKNKEQKGIGQASYCIFIDGPSKDIFKLSSPMRMDLLIRGCRFVVPVPQYQDLSRVPYICTFTMDPSTGSPNIF